MGKSTIKNSVKNKLAGIDVSTQENVTLPYTATEDCWIELYMNGGDSPPGNVYINSIPITVVVGNKGLIFPLKKGQIMSSTAMTIYYAHKYDIVF